VLLGGPVTASNVLPFGPFVDLAVVGGGVFWPSAVDDAEGRAWAEEASDHRMVWIDLDLPPTPEIHSRRPFREAQAPVGDDGVGVPKGKVGVAGTRQGKI